MNAKELYSSMLEQCNVSEQNGRRYVFNYFLTEIDNITVSGLEEFLDLVDVQVVSPSVCISILIGIKCVDLQDSLANKNSFRDKIAARLEELKPGRSKSILGSL